MRILVVGATGGTGREIVRQGLERGHDVTAFVRNPKRLGGESELERQRPEEIAVGLRVLSQHVLGDEAARHAEPKRHLSFANIRSRRTSGGRAGYLR